MAFRGAAVPLPLPCEAFSIRDLRAASDATFFFAAALLRCFTFAAVVAPEATVVATVEVDEADEGRESAYSDWVPSPELAATLLALCPFELLAWSPSLLPW